MPTLAGVCHLAGMDFVVKISWTPSGHTCGLPEFLRIILHSQRENDLLVLSASNLLVSHHPWVHLHPPTLLKSMTQHTSL